MIGVSKESWPRGPGFQERNNNIVHKQQRLRGFGLSLYDFVFPLDPSDPFFIGLLLGRLSRNIWIQAQVVTVFGITTLFLFGRRRKGINTIQQGWSICPPGMMVLAHQYPVLG